MTIALTICAVLLPGDQRFTSHLHLKHILKTRTASKMLSISKTTKMKISLIAMAHFFIFAFASSAAQKVDTLDREFDCSDDQRHCFRVKSIYSEETLSCHLPGTQGPCPPEHFFAVSRERAQNGDIGGACINACPEGFQRRVGNDEKNSFVCEPLSAPVCPPHKRLVRNIFGEIDCVLKDSTWSWAPDQPAHQRCRLPKADDTINPRDVPSSCVRGGEVLVNGQCYKVLERGPCDSGEWLVADRFALVFGHVVPVCVKRPCPEGQVLPSGNGKCLTVEEATSYLCSKETEAINFDISGEVFCVSVVKRVIRSPDIINSVNVGSSKGCVVIAGRCRYAMVQHPKPKFRP